ncbi:MAG: hypothetical protein WBD13_02130 [Burkholderiaceae bacterium]
MTLIHDIAIDPIPLATIVNHRSTRFSGETQTCRIDEILKQSVDGLKWLYGWLRSLGHSRFENLVEARRVRIEALLTQENLDRVARVSQELKPEANAPLHVAFILHDLRGTALHQIMMIASAQLAGGSLPRAYKTITILAHDHAKIMRHSVHGLDEPERLQDSAHRLHGIVNLDSRFPSMMFHNKSGAVRIDFSRTWSGDIATSCSEFSTVLKIIYNFIDNATRHTNNGLVLIRAYPKSPPEPSAVRLVVGNSIAELDRSALKKQGESRLWQGFTTTGSGLGLRAAAALVSEAFGLDGPQSAVDLGYVGCKITCAGYVAWMHWPTVPQKVHPEPVASNTNSHETN